MKTVHWNKVAAVMDTKTRAFFGKNCIIMPVFALGFTFIMRLLYVNIMGDVSGMNDFARGYSLAMGLVMSICMIGIYCPALLLAEEKEKNTLRVLMTSSVNGLEFFLGSIIPIFLATAVINFILIPVSGYDMDMSYIVSFAGVTTIASLISCILGMVLGIFAKNQVSAGTVITPVLMIFMLIPMFADMIDSLEKLSQFTFTGIVMEMMMRIMEEKESVITVQGIIVMSAEAALTALIFIWLYKRNGFERE
ncbi:MAG: ABC transporter permease [Anaerovoracaceae bacterium]